MTSLTTDPWTGHIRETLRRYDEALLRQLAHKLCRPRNQWPVDELIDRVAAALNNAAMIDRRLKELPPACRQILAVLGHSRQSRWPVGTLVEILIMLGHEDGLAPLLTLLESGLILPELFPWGTQDDSDKISARSKLKSFEIWLGRSDLTMARQAAGPMLLAIPLVTQRALGEDLGIVCPVAAEQPGSKAAVHEADGLDWPLRLAVLWQQTHDAPLRRTQQGEYFKRDFEKLQSDPLMSAAPVDTLTQIPDPGFFAAALASASGLFQRSDTEIRTADFPASWRGPLAGLLGDFWIALLNITSWNSLQGYITQMTPTESHSSAYFMALLLLARLPEESWAAPREIEDWVVQRHPYWRGQKTKPPGPIIEPFLLGIAYSLRLLQATKMKAGSWLIRLSPLGRWVMKQTEQLPVLPSFKQTLLVQPNLEMLAYRQGLTPELIVSLSKIATWKGLGPACTLQLEPGSVYRALEMGESLTSIVQLLEGHGMKAIPTTVLDSLKTWSNKRERISIYSSGAIFEFASLNEMNDAIARGLPAVRLTDRLAVVPDEKDIDYKHFRLIGTRDYTLPPEKCIDVELDGVTLTIDLARSDLLLETELQRFAELVQKPAVPGKRSYRLTPASLASARQQGVTLAYLENWFQQRTGLPISPAARLLMMGPDFAPVELRRQLVLHVASEEFADGVAQWPATRELVVARLGPRALVVLEENVPLLVDRLKELGVKTLFEG